MVLMANVNGHSGDVPRAFPPDLIIVTHRGPATLSYGVGHEILAGQAAGGLAPSLTTALAGSGATWLACATGEVEREVAEHGIERNLIRGIDVQYVALSEETVQDAYLVIANETLWFIYHGMTDSSKVVFDMRWRSAFENFRVYNGAFAKTIVENAHEGATIMVNDYHLPLVGLTLATKRPDLKTVHFSHTPFCTPDQLGALPDDVAEEILTSMSAFGACGFHTRRWADAFLDCLETYGVVAPEVFVCPLGVDSEALISTSSTPAVMNHVATNAQRFAGMQVIFRSDRLDPTKNVVRGFDAFERLLESRKETRQQVVFHARSYLSRTDIAVYRDYRDEVDRRVQEINERFGSASYQPIVFEIDDDYDASLAAYQSYDVLLVNPVLDGMNLIAKEAPVLNTRDGAVVLSRGAGAYDQLHDAVIGIDPLDVEGTAEALSEALDMPLDERARRSRELKVLAGENAPAAWLEMAVGFARTHRTSSF